MALSFRGGKGSGYSSYSSQSSPGYSSGYGMQTALRHNHGSSWTIPPSWRVEQSQWYTLESYHKEVAEWYRTMVHMDPATKMDLIVGRLQGAAQTYIKQLWLTPQIAATNARRWHRLKYGNRLYRNIVASSQNNPHLVRSDTDILLQ